MARLIPSIPPPPRQYEPGAFAKLLRVITDGINRIAGDAAAERQRTRLEFGQRVSRVEEEVVSEASKRAQFAIQGTHKAGDEDDSVNYTGKVTYADGREYTLSGTIVLPNATLHYLFFDPSLWVSGSGTPETQIQITTDQAVASATSGRRIQVGAARKADATADPNGRCFFFFSGGTGVVSAEYIYAGTLEALFARVGDLTVKDTLTMGTDGKITNAAGDFELTKDGLDFDVVSGNVYDPAKALTWGTDYAQIFALTAGTGQAVTELILRANSKFGGDDPTISFVANHLLFNGDAVLTDSAGLNGAAALTDPDADRLLFWDDSAGTVAWLTLGTNLSITGTTINATGASVATLDDVGDVNATGVAQGALLYRGATEWVYLPHSTAGRVLRTAGAAANPYWDDFTFANLSGVSVGGVAQGAVLYFNGTNWVHLAAGVSGQFLKTNGAAANPAWATASGTGDVVGPASSTDNAIVRFDGATGKLVQDSSQVTISDAGIVKITTASTVDALFTTATAAANSTYSWGSDFSTAKWTLSQNAALGTNNLLTIDAITSYFYQEIQTDGAVIIKTGSGSGGTSGYTEVWADSKYQLKVNPNNLGSTLGLVHTWALGYAGFSEVIDTATETYVFDGITKSGTHELPASHLLASQGYEIEAYGNITADGAATITFAIKGDTTTLASIAIAYTGTYTVYKPWHLVATMVPTGTSGANTVVSVAGTVTIDGTVYHFEDLSTNLVTADPHQIDLSLKWTAAAAEDGINCHYIALKQVR